MAFRVFRLSREIEIISIIDIVFLLLIFGIVISGSNIITTEEPGPVQEPIYKQKVLNIIVGRWTIDEQTNVSRVTIRFPGSHENPQSYDFPPDEEFLRMDNRDFEQLQSCLAITESIERYVDEYMSDAEQGSLMNRINVTITGDTKLRIISHIISTCSYYSHVISWLNVQVASD